MEQDAWEVVEDTPEGALYVRAWSCHYNSSISTDSSISSCPSKAVQGNNPGSKRATNANDGNQQPNLISDESTVAEELKEDLQERDQPKTGAENLACDILIADSRAELEKTCKELLLVCDFDNSLVDCNTDTWVFERNDPTLMSELKQLRDEPGFECWTVVMKEMLRRLAEKGYTRREVEDSMRCVPMHPMVKALLRTLHRFGAEIHILSDANSIFISEVLKQQKLNNAIPAIRVHTNPATWQQNRCVPEMYVKGGHDCRICAACPNLCKGAVLDDIRRKSEAGRGGRSKRVFYVGDGRNDLCPCLRLERGDVAFARRGYRLLTELQREQKEFTEREEGHSEQEKLTQETVQGEGDAGEGVQGRELVSKTKKRLSGKGKKGRKRRGRRKSKGSDRSRPEMGSSGVQGSGGGRRWLQANVREWDDGQALALSVYGCLLGTDSGGQEGGAAVPSASLEAEQGDVDRYEMAMDLKARKY